MSGRVQAKRFGRGFEEVLVVGSHRIIEVRVGKNLCCNVHITCVL